MTRFSINQIAGKPRKTGFSDGLRGGNIFMSFYDLEFIELFLTRCS